MTDTMTNDAALQLIAEGVSDVAAGNYKVAQGRAALAANLSTPPMPAEPVPEPKPPAVPVTRVATLAALTTALKAAKADEVIELAAGEYGGSSLKGVVASGVTVRAAGAKVTGLVLTACEGITFEGLSADLTAKGRVLLDGCKNIDLIGLTTRNATLYGVSIVRCDGVQVLNGDFADVKDGVHLLNSRRVVIRDSKFRRFRSDGVNMSGSSHVKVLFNDFADCIAGPTGHPDAVQVQTTGADGPAEDIEIRGNKMHRGEGVPYQGAFATVQAGGEGHRKIIVTDNDMEGCSYNAVMLSNVDGFEVTGNRVQPYADRDSRIQVDNSTNGKIEGNSSAVYQRNGGANVEVAGNAPLVAIPAR